MHPDASLKIGSTTLVRYFAPPTLTVGRITVKTSGASGVTLGARSSGRPLSSQCRKGAKRRSALVGNVSPIRGEIDCSVHTMTSQVRTPGFVRRGHTGYHPNGTNNPAIQLVFWVPDVVSHTSSIFVSFEANVNPINGHKRYMNAVPKILQR